MVEIGRRPRRRRWLLAPLLVATIVAAAILLLAPTVVAMDPGDGEMLVSSGTELRVTFSRVMDEASAGASLQVSPSIPGQVRWEGTTLVFEPDERWPSATAVTVVMRAGARSRLGLPLIFGRTVTFTTVEPSLLYLQDSGSGSRLFRLGLQGSEPVALLPQGTEVTEFALADGGRLATIEQVGSDVFIRLRRLAQPQEASLTIPCPTQLRCSEIALSPDSNWLAWVETTMRVSETGVAARGDSRVLLATTTADSDPIELDAEARLRSPHWVDDRHVAVYEAGVEQLWLYELVEESWIQSAAVAHELGEQWTWSSDGRFVVFPEIVLLDRPLPGADTDYYSHLMRVEVASGLRTDLSGTAADLLEDASPAYSPDGLQLAFSRRSLLPSQWTPGRQLWLMRSDGGNPRQLTDDSNLMHTQFAWRPDGEGLAFVTADLLETDSEVQLGYFDLGNQQSRLLVIGGYAPQWIR